MASSLGSIVQRNGVAGGPVSYLGQALRWPALSCQRDQRAARSATRPDFSMSNWSCRPCAFLSDPSITKITAIHHATKFAKNKARKTIRLAVDDTSFSTV